VVALTLIEAAYLTEVFRSGIEAINRNQVLSARSIGLSAWQAMRLVVLPQSVRIVLPDYSNRLIGLMKRTAETSVIAIAEILKVSQDLQSQFVNATPMVVGALLYLVVLFPMTRIVSRLEKTRPRT
jgi:polar amino acid transport system permease protein